MTRSSEQPPQRTQHPALKRIAFAIAIGTNVLLLTSSCGDMAHRPNTHTNTDAGSSNNAPTIAIDPPPVGGFIAPIVRFHVTGLSQNDAVSLGLIKGEATPRNLRDLRNDSISATLRKRVVETIVQQAADGHWEIALTQPLDLGQTYSLVAPSTPWAETLTTMTHDTLPTFTRVWPPTDQEGRFVVWCAAMPTSEAVPSSPQGADLGPGIEGDLDFGAVTGIGTDCVHWIARSGVGIAVPPVVAELADGTIGRLDPSPILLPAEDFDNDDNTSWEASCMDGQLGVGPLCVLVLDDRAVVTASQPWLVALQLSGSAHASVVDPSDGWVVRSLVPRSDVQGFVRVISVSGAQRDVDVAWRMKAPMERVVINEVLAHPVGPEPQQEWVELYNDGTIPVSLAGWYFDDVGGHTELPNATLRPGQYALLVGEQYDPSSWVDTPPVDGTLLLRVPVVGKGGLSNAGEPLRLLRADGTVASSVPAVASKYVGASISRVRPEALDVLGSFFLDRLGGTPGAENRVPSK